MTNNNYTKFTSHSTSYVKPPMTFSNSNTFNMFPVVKLNKILMDGPSVNLSNNPNLLSSSLHKRTVFSSLNKCNSSRCKCCKYLSTNYTITSSVNGRTFNSNFNVNIN